MIEKEKIKKSQRDDRLEKEIMEDRDDRERDDRKKDDRVMVKKR